MDESENTRALERLVEEQLSAVTDALPVLVSYIDASHRYRFVNRTFEKWLARSRENVIGRHVLDVVGQDIYEKIREPLIRALAGQTVRFETRMSLPGLGERDLEATLTPEVTSNGTVRGTVNLVSDITDRRQLELAQERAGRQLAASAARLELLARVSRTFAEAESDLATLLRVVALEITRRFGDTCAISLRSDADRSGVDDTLLGVPVFFDRDEEARTLLAQVVDGNRGRLDDAVVKTVVRTGRGLRDPQISPGRSPVFTDERYCEWLKRFPVRGMMAAPLRVVDRVIGVVVCTRRGVESSPDEEDLGLLCEVADRAAIAIDNAQLVAKLNDAYAERDVLYELTDGVNRAESLEGVYAPALDAISRQLRLERCAFLLFDPDGVIRFKASRGLSESYRRAVEGHSPWRPDELNAAAVVIPDVMNAPGLERYRTTFASEGIRSLAFVPVANGGRLLGKFVLYSEVAREFSAAEIKRAQTIADQVSAAVGQKQTQAERERLIEELTRTVRLNELLAGILSHDLRNPLGAILMSATVLLRKTTDETVARTAGRILSAGTRMNRMIAQLLDLTRVRAVGTLPIERARVDLAVIFRQAIDELPEKSSGEMVQFQHLGDTRGWWDGDRLAQVASNLVGNALKHGVAGQAVIVQIDGGDPSVVTVSVKNAGMIEPDLLPIVCEPFQGGKLHDRRGGLGLGLFITREIVTAHRGGLDISSKDDATTFTIRLPRAAP
jgi:PAS domain S-box-containing protein